MYVAKVHAVWRYVHTNKTKLTCTFSCTYLDISSVKHVHIYTHTRTFTHWRENENTRPSKHPRTGVCWNQFAVAGSRGFCCTNTTREIQHHAETSWRHPGGILEASWLTPSCLKVLSCFQHPPRTSVLGTLQTSLLDILHTSPPFHGWPSYHPPVCWVAPLNFHLIG